MSGPYCKTCKHFYPSLVQTDGPQEGDCLDPTKLISVAGGASLHGRLWVHEQAECMNHEEVSDE